VRVSCGGLQLSTTSQGKGVHREVASEGTWRQNSERSQANTQEGCKYVVERDLEKYFDTVNLSILIEVLSRTIKDGRVISLIYKSKGRRCGKG